MGLLDHLWDQCGVDEDELRLALGLVADARGWRSRPTSAAGLPGMPGAMAFPKRVTHGEEEYLRVAPGGVYPIPADPDHAIGLLAHAAACGGSDDVSIVNLLRIMARARGWPIYPFPTSDPPRPAQGEGRVASPEGVWGRRHPNGDRRRGARPIP